MQQVITFMAVVAGLVFSVAVALLVEEMIFGQVFVERQRSRRPDVPRPRGASFQSSHQTGAS